MHHDLPFKNLRERKIYNESSELLREYWNQYFRNYHTLWKIAIKMLCSDAKYIKAPQLYGSLSIPNIYKNKPYITFENKPNDVYFEVFSEELVIIVPNEDNFPNWAVNRIYFHDCNQHYLDYKWYNNKTIDDAFNNSSLLPMY